MRKLALLLTILIIGAVMLFLTAMIWISAHGVAVDPKAGQDGEAPSPAQVATAIGGDRRDVTVAPSGLAIPVAGVRAGELVDTFANARAGGARIHDAIDIMAPAGTLVVAAAGGTVEKLYFSRGGGGVTAYVRSPDGRWLYYYAHLQSYAPGLGEGQRVEAGDPIGRVGSTGNASAAGPHLHFAIYHMAPGERFYQGTPINPYPLLVGRWVARR